MLTNSHRMLSKLHYSGYLFLYKTHKAAQIIFNKFQYWPETTTLTLLLLAESLSCVTISEQPEQTASSLAFYLSINISPPTAAHSPLSAHTLASFISPTASPLSVVWKTLALLLFSFPDEWEGCLTASDM